MTEKTVEGFEVLTAARPCPASPSRSPSNRAGRTVEPTNGSARRPSPSNSRTGGPSHFAEQRDLAPGVSVLGTLLPLTVVPRSRCGPTTRIVHSIA